ncbi:hypothetical protein EVAR_5681_1 [Eumeta japonica]|uniref:Uncharacterized protein n=1 Tax=Eumeta variegata TaxID=151549 RepID=A0A4C1T9X8_EUMVA|nr:hypothetical protein EVAR_5681_1 [Eumeta japonica]
MSRSRLRKDQPLDVLMPAPAPIGVCLLPSYGGVKKKKIAHVSNSRDMKPVRAVVTTRLVTARGDGDDWAVIKKSDAVQRARDITNGRTSQH